METSNENLSLSTSLGGVEITNTTRLINLKSWQADVHVSPVDKTWVIPKANQRSYMQHKITVQSLKLWNCFQSIPKEVQLITPTKTVTIFPGNWTPDTLANFLTSQLTTEGIVVTYDPYQFRFQFCSAITILAESTATPYLGFPLGVDIGPTQISEFPPVALAGPQCINVWTNFTLDNIPYSEYLTCIPINVPYGAHIFFTQYDNSMAALCLDSDINHIHIILKDDRGNDLIYYDELGWEISLVVTPQIPQGFAPLEP